MADGIGLLKIERNRGFEDYRSLKQYFRNHDCEEILYETHQLTTAALAELTEEGGDTIVYLSANTTVYIRSEADIAGLRGASITITFVNNAGAVVSATATINASDSTTEEAITTTFQNLRSMISDTEALAANHLLLCNSDNTAKYGMIQDGRVTSAFSRYYVPAAVTGQNSKYFLGRVTVKVQEENEGDAVEAGHQISVAYTPKDCSNITAIINFNSRLVWEPCIELEPGSSVVFKAKKITNTDHHELYFKSEILEVDRLAK